ncbi:autophagy protein [Lambiella insularis]|nr:autophagy protein [Lambiella insularis]
MQAIATSRGYRIYTTDPFSKVSESKDGDIALLEMLFSTSLVALVLSPRKLRMLHTKKQQTICDLTFPTTVLAVRLNRKRLVVVLEDLIYLYEISNMKLLDTIETSPNPQAICALSSSSENNYLAYPLPQKTMPSSFAPPSHAPPSSTHITPTTGDVLLFDATKLEAVNVVVAHRSPLSCISINNTGTLLATASDKGTIVRVFSLPKADKLYQFRRGSMPAHIYCMSFNTTSSLLCVSSATETVHIFKLGGPAPHRRQSNDSHAPPFASYPAWRGRDRSLSPAASDSQPDFSLGSTPSSDSASAAALRKHNGTLMGMIRRTSQNVGSSIATAAGAYLPTAVAEMWEPTRDFAWCKIPKANSASHVTGSTGAGGSSAPLRSVVAMSSNSPQVMVVTNEGHFYVFGIDLEKGGEGTLVKVYEVGGESERLGASIMEE